MAEHKLDPYVVREVFPGEVIDFDFEWEADVARVRQPNATYTAGTKVRPSVRNGFQYSASGGTTRTQEPAWPTVVGNTVNDGSVTWTAEALAATSLDTTISTSTWTAVSGVGVTPRANDGTRTRAFLSTVGTSVGEYEFTNTVVFANTRQRIGRVLLKVLERPE